MKKNNFYIVGAPKAGTTSIYNYLKQHPSIFLPQLKELHYFSYPEVTNTYYNVPFISSLQKYENYYSDALEEQIKGDISPSYLFNENSAQRIYEYNKDAKIIIFLRNPIERSISHYLMDIRIGYQKKSLLNILNNPKQFDLFYKEYVRVSEYSAQIVRYQKYFSPKNILIIDFSELNRNIEEVLKKICFHLEIDNSFNFDFSKEYNTFSMPKNTSLIYFLKQNFFLKKILKIVPTSIIKAIKPIFYSHHTPKPTLIEEKKLLYKLLKKDILKLGEIVDINTQDWIKKYE